jgi:hypothetical protein
MKKIILLIAWFVLILPNASAQSLDKLLGRAQRYLVIRAAGNKVEMQRYVPVDKRNELLNRTPPDMSNPKLEGLDLTDDPKTVYVVYSATFLIKDVGPFHARVREAWNWDGKDWFVESKNLGSPLQGAAATTTNRPPENPLPFELSVDKFDLGKHVQGEVVTQTIDFKSDRTRFSAFRHNELKGLEVTGPTWTSKESGQLEIVLDTTLLDASVSYPVELEILDSTWRKSQVKFQVTAEIEPRLRLSQTPEIIDPMIGGTVELRIENRSKVSFKPVSLILTNRAYQISDYTRSSIAPGETLKISITYQPQTDPLGVALNVAMSPAVLPRPNFVLPLNLKLPSSQEAPGYTKEQLDEIIRRAR